VSESLAEGFLGVNAFKKACDEPPIIDEANAHITGLFGTNNSTAHAPAWGLLFSASRASDGYQLWLRVDGSSSKLKLASRYITSWQVYGDWVDI
jgi:hypothetical protein